MKAPRRPPGRPRTRPGEDAGAHIGFRAPRALKQRLEEAATTTGRSLSTEAQFRLEQSFRHGDVLEQAITFAFGSGLAGLLMLAGRVMRESGSSRMSRKMQDEGLSAGSWLADPDAYNEALLAAHAVLEEFRPDGPLEAAAAGQIAKRFADDRIDWVVNKEAPYQFGEREWTDRTRALLGDLMTQSKLLRERAKKDAAIAEARRTAHNEEMEE